MFDLAGLAADDINDNNAVIPSEYINSESWQAKTMQIQYYGDMNQFLPKTKALYPVLRLSLNKYARNCIALLHHLFSLPELISALKSIRDLIHNCTDPVIEGKVIYEFLENSPAKKWRDENWCAILDERKKLFT